MPFDLVRGSTVVARIKPTLNCSQIAGAFCVPVPELEKLWYSRVQTCGKMLLLCSRMGLHACSLRKHHTFNNSRRSPPGAVIYKSCDLSYLASPYRGASHERQPPLSTFPAYTPFQGELRTRVSVTREGRCT